MTSVQRIQRHGFRKWYERELLQSHAHLVMLLLSAIALLAGAEVYDAQAPIGDQFVLLLCVSASAVIGVWALRRYLYLLNHAEFVADQAVCSECHAYARWDLLDSGDAGTRLQVCCRGCGHRWEISL
ncbi:hypothetical protein [Caldimonas sp. KR1-144]|uniref:hypothetical protein n=1 Tax=Caldimonas sp. KR1-144 TaxID=3400911 RepID=UPI003BFB52F2